MPRGAAAPAAVVPAAANGGGTTGSIAANDLAAQELAERRKLARAAAAWAYENEVGSKAALKNDQFKDRGLTYNMVEPLLKELKAGGTKRRVDAPRDHHCQVLTNDERVKLAEWILACAAGQDPKDRTAVSAKVKEMLRARHASNKRRKRQRSVLRPSHAARLCACAVLCRARGPAGSGARCVGPRRACARSGHVLQHASRSCWATTQPWVRRKARRAHRRPGLFCDLTSVCVRRTMRVCMPCVGHWIGFGCDWGDLGVG
jgi:hypothetical protein